MTNPVTVDQVNEAISEVISLAITHTLEDGCSDAERAKVMLCLKHPSEGVEELLNEAHDLVVESLSMAIANLFNAILFPDD